MTGALLVGSALTLALAASAALPRLRTSGPAALLLVCAAGWPVVVLYGPIALAGHPPAPAARLSDGLGTLALTRVGAGLLAMTAASAWLRRLGRGQPGGLSLAVAVAIAPVAILAVSARGLVPLALLLSLVPLLVVGRWGAAGGAGRRRAVATRSVAIGAIGLLAGAALAPTVGLVRTDPSLVGLCVALAVAALVGLLPFAPWPVLASGRLPADADLHLTWVVPVGLLGAATLLAGEPRAVAASLQTLLTALGLATAVIWAAVAAGGSDRVRRPALQAADIGLMVVGLASGRLDGLVGALLLLLLAVLSPPALASSAPGSARVAGWLAAAGLPPLGAFPGRLLVLAAASTVAFLPTALVTVAMGGLLIAGARGAFRVLVPTSGQRAEARVGPTLAEDPAGPGAGAAAIVAWVAAGAAILSGPLGPVLVPLVFGVRW